MWLVPVAGEDKKGITVLGGQHILLGRRDTDLETPRSQLLGVLGSNLFKLREQKCTRP